MFRSLKWRLVPLLVLAASCTIPIAEHGWRLHGASAAAQAAIARPVTQVTVSGTPVRIVVPAAAIDLPVVPGSQDIHTKIWSVASRAANYATNTAPANNHNGQTLIYGHNNRHVFGALLGLKRGDQAVVYTSNNHTFIYSYSGSRDVTPDQASVFETVKHGTGLVLMTCDGDYFQYRHLMSFGLIRAS